MFATTRERTDLGHINWRKSKRLTKRNMKDNLGVSKGGIKAAKAVLRRVAADATLDAKGLRSNRLYLRNLTNWL